MFHIKIWKGHHSLEVFNLIQKNKMKDNELLILCPPRIDNLESFFSFLPSGKISYYGDFEGIESHTNESTVNYRELPSIGLFSSGTSNASTKLILYTEKNIESSNHGVMSFFKGLDVKYIYCYPQPYHIFGLALGYYLSIENSFELIFQNNKYSSSSHEKWHDLVKKSGINVLTLGTPTHFKDLYSYYSLNKETPPSSLTAIIGGASVSVDLWCMINKKLRITNPSIGYGCSEASPGVTHLSPGKKPEQNGNLGNTLPNVDLILSENNTTILGENICLAVIQNGAIIFPNGRFLIKDKLRKCDDGTFQFIRKNDLMLNRGGEKFSLEAIEDIILKRFSKSIVAVSLYDKRLGEDLGILVKGINENLGEIHSFLNKHYQRSFDEQKFRCIDSFPISSNAKVDRKKCAALLLEKPE
jgi:acyl-CoA synthetase (AMP-forming)/AMP-acid ligase II